MNQKQKVKENKKLDRDRFNISWILKEFPKKYKSKVFSILRYVVKNYNMKWNNDGVFIYKGKIIPDSNITHLVAHAVLKKIINKIPGYKEFYEGLKNINIPDHLVINEMGKKLISGKKDV